MKLTQTIALFETLDQIQQQPGLYIGKASVSDLFMFLVGYKFARKQLGIELTDTERHFYQNFHGFVEMRYNVKTSNSWAKIIMLYSPDEKTGFETFFKLLKQFKSSEYFSVNQEKYRENNYHQVQV
jgi:hypothetical protein